jgi:hypothetical protein
VNTVSLSVYEDLGRIAELAENDDTIKALVLAVPEGARASCGGADLNDFKGMDKARRLERYAFINQQLPRFHSIDRPIIAAIDGAAIGVGMVHASLCDFRVAAEDAAFSLPEIDYGLLSGCADRSSWPCACPNPSCARCSTQVESLRPGRSKALASSTTSCRRTRCWLKHWNWQVRSRLRIPRLCVRVSVTR